jgi:hypothetical protein
MYPLLRAATFATEGSAMGHFAECIRDNLLRGSAIGTTGT